jgi:hypothetical protein
VRTGGEQAGEGGKVPVRDLAAARFTNIMWTNSQRSKFLAVASSIDLVFDLTCSSTSRVYAGVRARKGASYQSQHVIDRQSFFFIRETKPSRYSPVKSYILLIGLVDITSGLSLGCVYMSA